MLLLICQMWFYHVSLWEPSSLQVVDLKDTKGKNKDSQLLITEAPVMFKNKLRTDRFILDLTGFIPFYLIELCLFIF